jgi:hypothetical protein
MHRWLGRLAGPTRRNSLGELGGGAHTFHRRMVSSAPCSGPKSSTSTLSPSGLRPCLPRGASRVVDSGRP